MTQASTTSIINFNLASCINGDRKSQKELYDCFSAKMFAICFRYAKNQMDAEDILQEGFIKLYRNLDKFRGEGSFEGWVRRIFVNTAIEHIRKQKLTNTDINEQVENSFRDSSENALDKLFQKDLLNSTAALSDGYKTVFSMYAVEGFSHKEIATQLGITESTSKSQFSRAKAILRSLLQGNIAQVAAS
ncbi:MAG: sigma-70 family RNA polymerase sigma factor [Chitinophagaceae bacterium]